MRTIEVDPVAGWPVRSRPLVLSALDTAPACARAHVEAVAMDWGVRGDTVETARLLASELVTNAIRAVPANEGGTVRIRLARDARSLLIEVWDACRLPPVPRKADPMAEYGRGLLLVQALSSDWGAYVPATGGKAVWCRVAMSAPPTSPGSRGW